MPIFHDGNGLIKNTKTVDARVCAPVTGEPLAGVPLMGGAPMPTPATMRPVVRFSGTGAAMTTRSQQGRNQVTRSAVASGPACCVLLHCAAHGTRMKKPDTWPGFDQVVGGSIRCGCNPITPLLEVWSLASGGDGVSNNNLAPATPTKKPPRWAVWLRSGGGHFAHGTGAD